MSEWDIHVYTHRLRFVSAKYSLGVVGHTGINYRDYGSAYNSGASNGNYNGI